MIGAAFDNSSGFRLSRPARASQRMLLTMSTVDVRVTSSGSGCTEHAEKPTASAPALAMAENWPIHSRLEQRIDATRLCGNSVHAIGCCKYGTHNTRQASGGAQHQRMICKGLLFPCRLR